MLQELRDSEMKPLQDLQLRPAGRVTQVLAAGNDSEFEEYVCAASSVLQVFCAVLGDLCDRECRTTGGYLRDKAV